MLPKTLAMLALLFVGILFLAVLFVRDCKDAEKDDDDIDNFDQWIDD